MSHLSEKDVRAFNVELGKHPYLNGATNLFTEPANYNGDVDFPMFVRKSASAVDFEDSFRDERGVSVEGNFLGLIMNRIADSRYFPRSNGVRNLWINVMHGKNGWQDHNFCNLVARVLGNTEIRRHMIGSWEDGFPYSLVGELYVYGQTDNWDEDEQVSYRFRRPLLIVPRKTLVHSQAAREVAREFELNHTVPEIEKENLLMFGLRTYSEVDWSEIPESVRKEYGGSLIR